MPEMTMLGSPSGRAYLRRDDFSFCPTSACWGGDNRTVAVRVIAEREPVTRIEQRDASSDANPYLALAAQVAAGLDGLDAGLSPPAMVTGNAYGRDDLPPLPSSLTEALVRFAVSDRARGLLGEEVHSKLVEFAVADCASDETSERSWF
jgi:glutamine synthetase